MMLVLPNHTVKQRPVSSLDGIPAFPLFIAPLPLLMLKLGLDVGSDGLFYGWHHVVHHVKNITQNRNLCKHFFALNYSQDGYKKSLTPAGPVPKMRPSLNKKLGSLYERNIIMFFLYIYLVFIYLIYIVNPFYLIIYLDGLNARQKARIYIAKEMSCARLLLYHFQSFTGRAPCWLCAVNEQREILRAKRCV